MKDLLKAMPERPPHIIHGNPHHIFPTHTHGLEEVGLPEMFINSNAFGLPENGAVINEVVAYLYTYKEEWERVAAGQEIEVKLWGKDEASLIIRPIDFSFAGVQIAYEGDDKCSTGYAQIYVKGDHHVLKEEFFIEQHVRAREQSEDCPCDICKNKHMQ